MRGNQAYSFRGEAPRCEHFVHIYDNDQSFVGTLADFVAGGLEQGQAVILFPTAAHQTALLEQLQSMGFDTVAAQANDQLIIVDASEMLSRFVINGIVDGKCFAEACIPLVKRASRHGRCMRGFGEMVAVLWEQGKHAAAIKLEQLWDEVYKQGFMTILCAYPKDSFTDAPTESIAHVCALHSKFSVA